MALNPETVFRQCRAAARAEREDDRRAAQGLRDEASRPALSPHPEIMHIQQKFSFPVACLVFALIGLALGLTVARDGKLAGFVIGVAVIFAYYIVMFLAEALTQGALPGARAVRGSGRPAS